VRRRWNGHAGHGEEFETRGGWGGPPPCCPVPPWPFYVALFLDAANVHVPCGWCGRHHRVGSSRCAGFAGRGRWWHDPGR